MLRVVDGCLPSDMATGNAAEIEEERRLLYVAMTRARHHLHLLVPQRFYVTQQAALGDRHVYGVDQPLPAAAAARPVRARRAECAERAGATAEGNAAGVDVGARIRLAVGVSSRGVSWNERSSKEKRQCRSPRHCR